MEVDYYPEPVSEGPRPRLPTEPDAHATSDSPPPLPHQTAQRSSESGQTFESPVREDRHDWGERADVAAFRTADELKEGAYRMAEQSRARLANRAHRLASAMDNARVPIDAIDEPQIANAASALAGQLDRVGSYLEGRDVRELAADTQRLGRARPALFLGGALAAGVVLGRFLRSSRDREDEDERARAVRPLGAEQWR